MALLTSIPNAHLSENSEALGIIVNSSARELVDTHWYAIHTHPRHEKRVRARLDWLGVESYLPLYESLNRWKNGQTMCVEFPLFPCYLFAKIDLRKRVSVLELPGVVSFVGANFDPWPLQAEEIESLRDGLRLRKPEPHPYLVTGQRLRIKSGPLHGLSGILVRRNGNLRVVLSVELLMQSVSVQVGVDDIELLNEC
jgi:transcription termination/antitermination protein NusG